MSKLKVEFNYSTIQLLSANGQKEAFHYQCFSRKLDQGVFERRKFESDVYFNELLTNLLLIDYLIINLDKNHIQTPNTRKPLWSSFI